MVQGTDTLSPYLYFWELATEDLVKDITGRESAQNRKQRRDESLRIHLQLENSVISC